MNVCLIPAYRRPEFLWHCLENIKLADGADSLHYIFRFDHGFDPDNEKVVKDFPFSHEIAVTRRTPYQLSKQSYSLLSGYEIAASKTDRLVFMVEEDVMVARDFFRWHIAAHEAWPTAFCSIAVANPNRTMVDTVDDPGAYYVSTGDYCSLGVCFTRDALRTHVLPGVTNRYYADPINYVASNFRGMPIGRAFAEQDGLIRRTEMRLGDRGIGGIVWPWKARAYHAGFYGKNRGAGPRGPLQERIERLAAIIYSDEAMRTFAKHPEWYEDSRPIDLNPQTPWTSLTLHQLNEVRNPVRF